MLTYTEFYNRVSAIEKMLNEAADHVSFNNAGMTQSEFSFYQIGKFFQALASSTLPSFYIAKCSFPVSILVHIMRMSGAKFSFDMFDPSDVEGDEDFENTWSKEVVRYSRMSSVAMFGMATSIIGSEFMNESYIDIEHWCNRQAEHLVMYCITHGFDITRYIDMV